MTVQPQPRVIFQRAIEQGDLSTAETTVREIGHVWLTEALALTALVAQKEPHRRSRFVLATRADQLV